MEHRARLYINPIKYSFRKMEHRIYDKGNLHACVKLLIFLCRNEENVSIYSGRLRMFYFAMKSYFQHRSVDPIHYTLLLYFTQIWACLVIADHAYIKLIFVFSFIECLFPHQKLFHDFSFLYLHKNPQIDSLIPSEDLLWFKKEAFFLSGFSFSDTFTNRLVKGFWAKFWGQEFSQTGFAQKIQTLFQFSF